MALKLHQRQANTCCVYVSTADRPWEVALWHTGN